MAKLKALVIALVLAALVALPQAVAYACGGCSGSGC